jgi:acyl-CoA dehydrogenase
MEVLAKYGNEEQKARWLQPLLDGKIRSAYVMTEPDVASSDATNISLDIRKSGNEYIINGSKWWISGAGDPRCELYVIFGTTQPNNPDKYKRQSIILCNARTPGITIKRMMKVYGYDDAPHGHAHLLFKNVRVPASNIILGDGRGFEVMQGRMGPGRIHHAMRSIGAAELALEWMLARANDPKKKPFGKLISEQGSIIEQIAQSRLEVDAARLIVLNAAAKIDQEGAKAALAEIAEAKILTPNMALTVIDRAVQVYGGEGICQDTPLANLWAHVRTVRIVDGPDAVHLQQLGKKENKKYQIAQERIAMQAAKIEQIFQQYGTKRDIGSKL